MKANKKQKIITEIDDIIKQNIFDPQFNICSLTATLHVSWSYLDEIVWMKYCMIPHCLVETIKLEIALDLIGSYESNIWQICKIVGYGNPKTFRTAFKKRLNITHGECKKQFMQSENSKAEVKVLKASLWNNAKKNYP